MTTLQPQEKNTLTFNFLKTSNILNKNTSIINKKCELISRRNKYYLLY